MAEQNEELLASVTNQDDNPGIPDERPSWWPEHMDWPPSEDWNSGVPPDASQPNWGAGPGVIPDPENPGEFIPNPDYGQAPEHFSQAPAGIIGSVFNLPPGGEGGIGDPRMDLSFSGGAGLEPGAVHSDYVKGHYLQAQAQVAASQNQAKARLFTELLSPYLSEKLRSEREIATTEKGGVEQRLTEQLKGQEQRSTQEAAAQSEMEKLFGKEVTDELTGEKSRTGGTMQFDRDTAKQMEKLKGTNTLAQIAAQASEGRRAMGRHAELLRGQKAEAAANLDKRFQDPSSIPFANVMSGLMGMGGAGGAGGAGGVGGAGMGGSAVGQGMGQTTALNTMAGVNPYTGAAANVANIAGAGAGGQNALSALGAGFQGQAMGNLNAANLYGGDVQTAAGALGSQLGQQYSNIGQVMRPGATAFGTGMGNVAQAYGTNIGNSMNIGMG